MQNEVVKERKKERRESVFECVTSSKPHVRILLGKTGMLQDEKQMWTEEDERRRKRAQSKKRVGAAWGRWDWRTGGSCWGDDEIH